MENHIFIYNEIGAFGNTADEIQAEINKLPKAKEIVLHISSPGGEVFTGWTIGNMLKSSNKKITVIIEGLCASIATWIALQADEVKMAETARFMIHNPKVMTEGEEKDLSAAADQLASIKSDLVKIYKSKTGIEESKISEMMDDETWMTPEEAKKLGFIDEIITDVKAVAKLNTSNINIMSDKKEVSKMDQFTEKFNKMIDDLLNKISNVDEPTNMSVELMDGTMIFVESEDGELEGKSAFATDEEGNKTDTPAPDGTHELKDGRSITIAAGIVESVQEAEAKADEDEEMNNQIAELKAENAKLLAKIEEKIEAKKPEEKPDELAEMKATMKSVVTELTNIKAMAVGGDAVVPKGNIKPTNSSVIPEGEDTMKSWGKSIFKI